MNRKIEAKTTKQIVIDSGLHRSLKVIAAQHGKSIRSLIEELLADYLPDVLEGRK